MIKIFTDTSVEELEQEVNSFIKDKQNYLIHYSCAHHNDFVIKHSVLIEILE